jgi:hypothetical protein
MWRVFQFAGIAVLLVLASTMQGCTSLPSGGSDSFIETFTEAGLRRWMAQPGTWGVKEGRLFQMDGLLGGDWAERPKIIANYTVGSDFRIETEFRHQPKGSIGIMFRYHDNGQTLFVIFHDGAGIIIGKVDNPKEKESGDWYPYPYDLASMHKAAIEVHGAKIEVYLDEGLAASNEKWGTAYTTGAVGLSTATTTAEFDNVTVRPLK